MAEREVERRLAAVVAADVVGYSRLMEADESGTLAQLKALRKELIDPKIAEYRGRIVKTTGDGILLEYASVTDAVQPRVEPLVFVASEYVMQAIEYEALHTVVAAVVENLIVDRRLVAG